MPMIMSDARSLESFGQPGTRPFGETFPTPRLELRHGEIDHAIADRTTDDGQRHGPDQHRLQDGLPHALDRVERKLVLKIDAVSGRRPIADQPMPDLPGRRPNKWKRQRIAESRAERCSHHIAGNKVGNRESQEEMQADERRPGGDDPGHDTGGDGDA